MHHRKPAPLKPQPPHPPSHHHRPPAARGGGGGGAFRGRRRQRASDLKLAASRAALVVGWAALVLGAAALAVAVTVAAVEGASAATVKNGQSLPLPAVAAVKTVGSSSSSSAAAAAAGAAARQGRSPRQAFLGGLAAPSSPSATSRRGRRRASQLSAPRVLATRATSGAPSAGGAPVPGPEASKRCALILQRTYVRRVEAAPGAGDSSNSLLATSDEPTGRRERICISYEQVNEALAEAKRRRRFVAPSRDQLASVEPAPQVVAELGELNLETSRLLAQRFDMSNDEIANGLPLIDTRRTDLWPLCPLMQRPVRCDPTGRFRSFTGHCNNLERASWGAAQTPFARHLPPAHPDGLQAERASVVDGAPLPAPRLVTATVHRDHDTPSSDLSLLVMVWGQIIDHDLAMAAPPRDEQGMDFNCCQRQHPNCKPLEIPANDPFYARHKQRCMDFKRSLAGLRPNCALGPRVHINSITATIDANTVYGSTKTVADQLRTFAGGRLRFQDAFKGRANMKPLLPAQLDRPDLDCFGRPNANSFCFLGGDERVNEQPTLTALHTLYMRDHNRMADKLAQINPHWDDDRLYHEARHIEAAKVQHVLVSEYLPMLLGAQMMQLFNLTTAPPGLYYQGYDPHTAPIISHAFSTAAFRQGHTFIQGQMRLYDPVTHEFLGSEPLRSLFKRPFHYYRPGRLDQVVAGIVNTPAQAYDPFVTQEISGHLFQEPGQNFGMDLPAINLARGREQGTPGYNAWRQWCGLPRAESFEDLQPSFSNQTAQLYAKLYKHVDDLDLWSAGVSERRLPGAQIGPTFACIIARQFEALKKGDRFWYENQNQVSSFTQQQLREIKKITQARIICANTDSLAMIQRQVLKMPHPVLNPRVPCAQLPDLDLSHWREDPAAPGVFATS